MKDLVVKLKVDGSGVFPAFAMLEKRAGKLASEGFGRLKGAIAGAFGAGAIAAYTKSTLDWAGHLTDVATRLGVSTEYIQEMEFALKQSGASMDDLVSFTEKLNRARAAALSNSPQGKQIAETFRAQFGIDSEMLKGPVQPIIDAISKQFESGNVQTLTTALSRMGIKGAGAMTAAFADGLSSSRDMARKVGAIVGEDIVEQLDMAGDQLSAFAMVLRAEFAPSVVATARALVQATGWVKARMDYVMGGTHNWSALDYVRGAIKATTPGSDKLIAQGFMNPGPQFDTKTADQMRKESEDQFDAILKGIDESVKARSARRKSSGLGSFDVTPLISEPKDRSYHAPSSDSLISVGNFLGAGRSAMQVLAQETNNILRSMDSKLGKIADRQSEPDSRLGIAEEG